jgi:hypothetical protein
MRDFNEAIKAYEDTFGICLDRSSAEWFYTLGKLHAIQERHEALTKETTDAT